MNRLEKIKSKQEQIANRACQSYVNYQTKDFNSVQRDITERKILYDTREKNRSPVEIRISERERILRGRDESRDDAPGTLAWQKGQAVARLHEYNATIEPKGFGTGFLIAPNLLLTNHHVFESQGEAENCVANFGYEIEASTRNLLAGQVYRLRPDIFFYNYEELDYAIVYVEEKPIIGNKSLTAMGLLPLIETKGKVKKDSLLNIIQYPQGGIKKYTTEENSIINIDDEKGIIYYYTDTQVGSSGSPGFNEFWEVAALHYTGVPDTNEKGEWLTKKKEVWNKLTMSESEVNWIANAGKSISKIVGHLRSVQLNRDRQNYIDLILGLTSDPLESPASASVNSGSNSVSANLNSDTMDKINMNFYGTANLYFAPPQPPVAAVITSENGVTKSIETIIAIKKKKGLMRTTATEQVMMKILFPASGFLCRK